MTRWLGFALLVACTPRAPSDAAVEPAERRAAPVSSSSAEPKTADAVEPAERRAAPVSSSSAEPKTADDLALVRRFPEMRERFPRAAIGAWPTPVDPLPVLAEELGVLQIHIKRDDRSAEPYGGSKPRKLELFLGAALAANKKTVVTMGSVGSHHAVATAIYGERLGLETHLLLMPEPPSADTRRALLSCMRAGAELELVGNTAEAARRAQAIAELSPDDVAIIPAGGSSALGNLGFVSAGLELGEQVAAGVLEEPEVVYLAMGTMGSAVGLAIGLEAAGLSTAVVAVRVASSPSSQRPQLQAMFDETLALLRGADPDFPAMALRSERLRIDDGYLGAGYALPTTAGAAATDIAGRHGLTLDPTYTAKAFAAFLDAARTGRYARLLFWHTHAAQQLDTVGVDPAALPAALRTYAR